MAWVRVGCIAAALSVHATLLAISPTRAAADVNPSADPAPPTSWEDLEIVAADAVEQLEKVDPRATTTDPIDPRRAPSIENTETPSVAVAPTNGAASSGRALTADDDDADDPYALADDGAGDAYGGGITDPKAKGGDGNGTSIAPPIAPSTHVPVVAATPPPPPTIDAPTIDRSRRASLDVAGACRGYFPSDADDDAGNVTVRVVVTKEGVVTAATITAESPGGEGFGDAARSCVLSRKFAPALDRDGHAIDDTTLVAVRFVR